jgi:CIC family chloride channel protein
VDTREERKLLHRLERAARGQKVPLHTRVVVARSVDGAILETIRERHIKLLVMGWKGYASAGGTIFGEVVDTLIHHAPCEILLVKLGDGSTYPDDLDRDVTWVIPTTGGPNTLRSLELLPALAGLYPGERSPELWFCQVYSPEEMVPDLSSLEAVTGSIEGVIDKPIVPLQVRATSVPEAVIHLARSEHCSLVLLGASGESLLDRFLHGNIPSTIARSVDCTVLLYRGELTG